jgi:hypothetical protein
MLRRVLMALASLLVAVGLGLAAWSIPAARPWT